MQFLNAPFSFRVHRLSPGSGLESGPVVIPVFAAVYDAFSRHTVRFIGPPT